MDTVAVDLTGVRATAPIELYARWLDSTERHPILGNRWPRMSWNGSTSTSPQFDSMAADPFAVGVRSRVLDDWVREFLAAHPGAVVLDLGCGLASRVFRVDPAAGHCWYDLDFPDAIEVKREPYSCFRYGQA
jgi:O-methyltransferase involved in polyketide biosynthesis